MVKLSIVFGALALATTANAACSDAVQKCATDYATAAGGAGTDMTKACSAFDAYKKCFEAIDVSTCTEAEKTGYDAAKGIVDQTGEQMAKVCTGGGGGGGGSGGCDQQKATTACKAEIEAFTAFQQSATKMAQDGFSFKAFTDMCANGLTTIGAYTKCAAGNGCGDMATQATDTLVKTIETGCAAGPEPNEWLKAAMADDAFKKCMGDNMPADGAAPTCDQSKELYKCGKDFPAGTKLVEACEAFKKVGDGCDLTCPTANTKAAADSSPAYAGDTGAASTAQISTSVVIAAVAFAGMAN